MASYSGMFFGYREALFSAARGRISLGWLELQGRIPYTLDVFADDAGDSYSAMETFGGQSLILWAQVWDKAAIIQWSYDGTTYQDEKEIDPDKNLGTFLRRMAMRGFRIKNKAAGQISRYQVVAFR